MGSSTSDDVGRPRLEPAHCPSAAPHAEPDGVADVPWEWELKFQKAHPHKPLYLLVEDAHYEEVYGCDSEPGRYNSGGPASTTARTSWSPRSPDGASRGLEAA
jgi:hypothetical protein